MIKVRATQDGYYAGYYRLGPIDSDAGHQPGEIFEVDETPHEVLDEHNRPVYEQDANGKPIPVIVNGKQKLDVVTGKPAFKVKVRNAFSANWMERVSDDAEITNDYPTFEETRKHGVLSIYTKKKPKSGKPAVTVAMPAVPVESPI